MVQKIRQDLDDLKSYWEEDPTWDIELTEGFEDYYDELFEYRVQMENKWADERVQFVKSKAEDLNCSYDLVEYLLKLESKIKKLEERLDNVL